MTFVHFELTGAIGRVYYKDVKNGCDPYEAREAYDAVFTITFLGSGKAKLSAAHGLINRAAYRQIASKLFNEFGIHHCIVERSGKEELWDMKRAMGDGTSR